jgi:hypothetical protein
VDNEHRLLELEIDTIYGLAPRPWTQPQRLATPDIALVFGWSPNASVMALSQAAAELVEVADLGVDEPFAPEVEPSVVTIVTERLLATDQTSDLVVTGGPSYVFPQAVAAPKVGLPVIVSDPTGVSRARRLTRPDNWQTGEWTRLISGEIGQWAMAVDGLEPVSICHPP